MRRIIYILLALAAALNARFAKGQNCPANPSYTNQSGTFDLSSGRTIVLNNGGTFQITVQNNFSSTSSICVTNGSTVYLSFQNVNNMQKGGTIYTDAKSKLNFGGNDINSFPLTITNAGTTTQSIRITYADGATITNSGTYSITSTATLNSGAVSFTNSGILTVSSLSDNSGTFTFTNSGTATFNSGLTVSSTMIINSGTLTVNGSVTLQGSSTVRNTGYIYLQNNSSLSLSSCTFTNSGVLYVTGSIGINSGSTLNNLCTVRGFSSFTNNGTVSNTSLLLLTITSSACSFTNQGAFTNGSSALVQGYDFYNDGGSITGGGNFYFTNTTRNQATFSGTNGNTIDFYDATNLTTKIFDIQNTNPTNTIKLVVTPNTVTSFLSCTDVAAPVITSQPTTQTLCNASSTETKFSVTATSSKTPSYQWYKNEKLIEGATSSVYAVSNLTLADTANTYYVTVTNSAGSTTSNKVSVKYIITGQPESVLSAIHSSASFTVKTSGATAWQWQKNGSDINGATSSVYTQSPVALADSGSYAAIVSYSGGTCTSSSATLTAENVPTITAQPQWAYICSASTTSVTFSVTAASRLNISYQWYKNEKPIEGATASTYTLSNLTPADTANFYNVVVTNQSGTSWSSSAYIKYIVVSQPTPATQTIATGNKASFAIKTSGVKTWQWQKDGVNISGATTREYALAAVNVADSGKYTVFVRYDGGTCTSDAAVLNASTILYSKAKGSLTDPAAWGVNYDGSGSSPVDFTREEHVFRVYNRSSAETGGNFTIAGTLDVSNSNVIITPNTTLDAGRIIRVLHIRSEAPGTIAVSNTSNLTIHGINNPAYAGASDLYFDPNNNTIKNLVISNHAVTLHTVLNMAPGKDFGTLQVNSGTFNTSNLLTLKSDSLGTAGIARSFGFISGMVTIERFIHARRAWRFMGAPVTSANAPSIHAAWQEGAKISTSNPAPGFGTHITGGTEDNGFDRSPTNNSSLKYLSNTGTWTAVANTYTTPITQYPAYMFFIRGNRSYDILSTTAKTTPTTTVIRVTGNVYQGKQEPKIVSAKGYTLAVNPYASPINIAKLLSTSRNVNKRIRVWDPTLAGSNGVGAWVIVDGTTGTYRTTPPSTYVSTVLQAGQGFILESADGGNDGYMPMNEDLKDFTASTISGDRIAGSTTDTSLEVNLKLFNRDGTASIADGILYNFGARNNDSADADDAFKMYNAGENIEVKDGSSRYAIDSRTSPKEGDSLALNVYSLKAAGYQLEFVPSLLANKSFALYDKYLNSLSPISATDTTRITFSVLSSVAASKAADRFTIVTQKSKVSISLPAQALVFTKVRTYTKDNAINAEWTVENEAGVLYYGVEKSADGKSFTAAGNVIASAKGTYTYVDASPAAGINYYRIRSVAKDGSVKYAPVVTGQLEAGAASAASVSVYPNPLTGSAFTLTLSSLAAGSYTVNITDASGTTVYSKSIVHVGGTASQKIVLPHKLAAGVYYLHVAAATKTVSTVKVWAN